MKSTLKKISLILVIAIVFSVQSGCDSNQNISAGKTFEPTWESLKEYQIPRWFADAKFGIFIHWGVYSVPAHKSEWYPRFMYQDSTIWHQTDPKKTKMGPNEVYEYHVNKYGHPSEFGYKDFVPMFKAEKFNATEWIDIFQKAGAKYVVQVAEHHDAFAMYNSNVTRWNSVKMGPELDIVGELQKAADKVGMKFGVSSHFAFNWDYFNHENRFDTSDPNLADLYGPAHERYAPVTEEFMDLWWKRTTDIIDNYKPEILWFDFYFDRAEFSSYHPKLASYYYNMGIENDKEVVLQTKNMGFESYPEGTNVLDIERGKLSDIRKDVWQTDTSIGKNSWCYTAEWQSKTANSLIDDLIDIVSKNGTMLLNVGPKADGTIPQDQKDVLFEMGEWLQINGEAIYKTRPWVKFGEGPTVVEKGHHSEGDNKEFTSRDIRFTTKQDALFAIVLDVPENGETLIESLVVSEHFDPDKIKSIEILGEDVEPIWESTENGLLVKFSGNLAAQNALTIKINTK